MNDRKKTKEQLIHELAGVYNRISELEQSVALHKQMDDTLQASEIRYRRLFETAQDGILILDAGTGRIIDVNPFLVNMLGYSHEEFLGKRLWEIGPFKDTEASRDSFNKLQTQGYVRYEDLPLQTKDGRHMEVEFVSNVYQVNQNQVIQCNIRDITARKRAEEALQKAKEELENRVLERTAELRNANDQLQLELIERKRAEKYAHKETDRMNFLLEIYLNAPKLTDRELYDYVLEKAVSLTNSSIGFFHLVNDDQLTIELGTWNSETLRNCSVSYDDHYPIDLAGNWVDCIRLKKQVVYNDYQNSPNQKGFPEGHYPVQRFMSIPVLEQDKVRIIFGVGNKAEDYDDHDVVQLQLVANEMFKILMQRQAEEAQQKSEERYRMLFNSITDALFVLEIKADGSPGHFLEVNDVACDRLGYSRDELLTMSPSDIDAPASDSGVDLLHLLTEQLTNGQNRIFEQVHIAKDGHRIPVEINARTFDMQGRLVNIKLARDISHRKQTEEEKKRLEIQLIQAQKIEALGKLAGGIAHDFKNILQPILLNAELISDLNPYGKQEREYLDEIIEAAQLGKNLVRQINQFGTRKKMYLKPIALGRIVQDALTFIKRSLPPRITFRQWVKAKESLVKADPTQIYQLIINLCMNAVQAMNQGKGFLGVSLKETEVAVGSPAIVSDLNPGKYVLLTVRDSGCGISPEIQDRIFDPFFTTQNISKGTGLGLAVVHEVIQNADGSVLLHSEIGKGTRFKVFFPLYVEAQDMLIIPGPQITGQGEDILLVDDNTADLRSIHQLLVHLGFNVTSTSDPQKALNIFRNKPDKFVLLITDQVMPRMKGIELASKVLEIREDVPVIVCSGSEEAIQELQNSRTDIHAYIHKPFSKTQLMEAMQRVLS